MEEYKWANQNLKERVSEQDVWKQKFEELQLHYVWIKEQGMYNLREVCMVVCMEVRIELGSQWPMC